jgi:hypothetical protein
MNLVDVKRLNISGARFRVRFKLPNGCDCEVFLDRPVSHSIEPIALISRMGPLAAAEKTHNGNNRVVNTVCSVGAFPGRSNQVLT